MTPYHPRKRPVDPNIALRIEVARLRKGLTQAGLAELVGVTESAISHWETGRHEPREHWKVLAEKLGISVEWLRGEQVLTDEDRKLEETLLKFIREGGQDLQDLLDRFDSAEALMECLRRNFPEFQ